LCTDVLQRSVPDRVRAFALGLADAIMVLAAMFGALVAPGLASLVGPVPLFVGLGVSLAVAVLVLGRVRYPSSEPAALERAGRLTPASRPAEGLELRRG
jgi:hypothetical protein